MVPEILKVMHQQDPETKPSDNICDLSSGSKVFARTVTLFLMGMSKR